METMFILNIKNLLVEFLVVNSIASAILVIIAKNPVISVIFLISLVLNAALFLIVKGMPFIGIAYILIYLGAIIVLFLFVIMMINIKLTDILETGTQYTKNIPLALTVSGLFLYEFMSLVYNGSTLLSAEGVISDGQNFVPFQLIYYIISEFIGNAILSINNVISYFFSAPSAPIINNELFKFEHIALLNTNWPDTFIVSFTQIVSVAYSLYTYGSVLFLLSSIILLLAMVAPIYLSRRS